MDFWPGDPRVEEYVVDILEMEREEGSEFYWAIVEIGSKVEFTSDLPKITPKNCSQASIFRYTTIPGHLLPHRRVLQALSCHLATLNLPSKPEQHTRRSLPHPRAHSAPMGGLGSKLEGSTSPATSQKPAFGVTMSDDLISNLHEIHNNPSATPSSAEPRESIESWRMKNSARSLELEGIINKLQANYKASSDDASETMAAISYKVNGCNVLLPIPPPFLMSQAPPAAVTQPCLWGHRAVRGHSGEAHKEVERERHGCERYFDAPCSSHAN